MSKKKKEAAHPTDVSVGKKIKKFRIRSGKSQKSLGDDIGVTFQQIQKYESGGNRVSASSLFEIAQALNTPIEQFFYNSEQLLESLGGLVSGSGVLADGAEGTYYADDKVIMQYLAQIRDLKVKAAIIALLKSLAEADA